MPLAETRPYTALVVMPPGPARKDAARALRAAGFRLTGAREPYEGTAKFVEQPTDLVLLSLERFRARDVAFVETVRRRSASTRILLVVPDGRRSEAVRALEAGADAYVLLPFFGSELGAIATRLVTASQPREPGPGPELARLATEVSHAINNPLQVLSLMAEEHLPDKARAPIDAEVARIQEVVTILGRFGHLGPPQKDRGLVGPLLVRRLEGLAAAGVITIDGRAPDDGPAFAFDADQLGSAFDDLAAVLAAHGSGPIPIAAQIQGHKDGSGLLTAAVRARGVEVDGQSIERLRETVVWSHDETRAPLPGLALVEAVARAHGGELLSETSRDGTVLALKLPL